MITTVRAKMGVQSVEKTTYTELTKFQCVMGGKTCAEDNNFASATPGGKMELSVDNKAAHGFFKPGKSYYIDIIEVPEEPTAK